MCVVSCLLVVVSCVLCVDRRFLFDVVCCVLMICLMCDMCCFGGHCLLFVVRCVLFVVCCVRRLMFVAC